MSFVDSLQDTEIEKRKNELREKEEERKLKEFKELLDTFESLIKRRCSSSANAGAKSFAGYFARDWNEFGFSYEILNFPEGISYIGDGGYESKDILGFGVDRSYADKICNELKIRIKNLGFVRFSVNVEKRMLQDGKLCKSWCSISYKFRIVNTREEYVVFVQLNW